LDVSGATQDRPKIKQTLEMVERGEAGGIARASETPG
jgi:hypothetical protein